jgi:hypothetical protein
VTRVLIRASLTVRLSPLRQQDHYPRGGVHCSLTSSLRMVVPLLTTTSRRSPPFTWSSTCVVGCRSSSRPSLARRPVLSQLVASPTSFPQEEPVSASHEKSPPRTTSSAPTSAWAQTHCASITTDACEGTNLHITREQQLATMHAACPGKSLNAGLTGRATITSPSSPTLPHARLRPRHSSTLYDAHKPRLRLGRGEIGKHSADDELKLLGKKAKRPGVNGPTRPRGDSPDKASRLGFNAPWWTTMYELDLPGPGNELPLPTSL